VEWERRGGKWENEKDRNAAGFACRKKGLASLEDGYLYILRVVVLKL
jgi:hypothetical protein